MVAFVGILLTLTTCALSVLSMEIDPCERQFGLENTTSESTLDVGFTIGSRSFRNGEVVRLEENNRYEISMHKRSYHSSDRILVRVKDQSGYGYSPVLKTLLHQLKCESSSVVAFHQNQNENLPDPREEEFKLGVLQVDGGERSLLLEIAITKHDEKDHSVSVVASVAVELHVAIAGNVRQGTTFVRTSRELDEFPTRAPGMEDPSRNRYSLLDAYDRTHNAWGPVASQEEEPDMTVPTRAPFPTRAPHSTAIASQEEPEWPTRAPSFPVVINWGNEPEEFPTRAPRLQAIESDEQLEAMPTTVAPTGAPSFRMGAPVLTRFTNRPTSSLRLPPCFVCGSSDGAVTKPMEMVATETTLFGTCFDIDFNGRSVGYENCDIVQGLAAEMCGCLVPSGVPSDAPSLTPSSAPSTTTGMKDQDGDRGDISGITEPTTADSRANRQTLWGTIALIGATILAVASI